MGMIRSARECETGTPVETEIVRVVSLSTLEITKITQFKGPNNLRRQYLFKFRTCAADKLEVALKVELITETEENGIDNI